MKLVHYFFLNVGLVINMMNLIDFLMLMNLFCEKMPPFFIGP